MITTSCKETIHDIPWQRVAPFPYPIFPNHFYVAISRQMQPEKSQYFGGTSAIIFRQLCLA